MKKILAVLISLALLLSMGAALATKIELTGYDANGNEAAVEIPEDCKLILLDLWQPWCYPCLMTIPSLVNLYEKYQDAGLLVVGAFSYTEVDESTDNMSAWEIAEAFEVNYPVIRFDEAQQNALTMNYPTLLLLDADGNILPLSDEVQLDVETEEFRLSAEEIVDNAEEYSEEDLEVAQLFLEDEDSLRAFAKELLEMYKTGYPSDMGLLGAHSEETLENLIVAALDDPNNVTGAAETATKSSVDGYCVTITDEDGNPVSGVAVQICPGDRCIMHKTDEEGVALFEGIEAGTWELHLLKIPSGYELASELPETTSPDESTINIVLRRTDS